MTVYKIEDGGQESTNNKKVTVRGVLVLVGGIFVHLSLGSLYSFGNFSPYIISYVRARTSDTAVRNVDAIWVGSIGSIFHCVGMTLGGLIDRKHGPRVATAIGCTIFTAAVMCSYLTVKQSFALFVVSNGAVYGVGAFIAYGPPISAAIKWFPGRAALVSGFVVCGFGGGSMIFNQVITGYINPDNLSPDLVTDDGERYFSDPDLLDRVPYCFLLLGGIYAALQIIGVTLIALPPVDLIPVREIEVTFNNPEKLEHNGRVAADIYIIGDSATDTKVNGTIESGNTKETNTVKIEHPNTSERLTNPIKMYLAVFMKLWLTVMAVITILLLSTGSADDLPVRQVILRLLKSKEFYMMWLTVVCLDGGMMFVSGLYKAYGQTFIHDDLFLAVVGSCSSVFNCIGRPIWGNFMDRFGFTTTIRCLSVGLACVLFTLLATEQLGKVAFFIWICMAFFCFCGLWAALPASLARMFGTRNMALNYGFLNTANGAAGLLGALSATLLKDIIGWHGIFFVSGGMAALPYIWMFFFNDKIQAR